jgi:hypothetical protein
MSDLLLRTEDIHPKKVLDYYVETDKDKQLIEALKRRSPVLLEGARGVGKSFLLRVAERKLIESLEEEAILPVYVRLTKSILLRSSNEQQFHHWVLARLSSGLIRALRKNGLTVDVNAEISILGGSGSDVDPINEVIRQFEESYMNPGKEIDVSKVPGVMQFKYAVEDICDKLGLSRIVVLFDEAAHVLQPTHQRQFFTLFRDLRSPYISCNAAVYPGITSYGDAFERSHDATIERIERDVRMDSYIDEMWEIVAAQADSDTLKHVQRREREFKTIAYAASGNPRYMLKMLSIAPKLKSVTDVIKDYFRNNIWVEHSQLSNKFKGLERLVEWGSAFLRDEVLPSLKAKNGGGSGTTRYFWVRNGAPEFVYKSLQLLMYTGIVSIDKESLVATNDWQGTRYAVNLGIIFSAESLSVNECLRLSEKLSVSNPGPVLFNRNHPAFSDLRGEAIKIDGQDNELLDEMLKRPIEDLDLTEFKRTRLREQGLTTIGEVLRSSENLLKRGYYIGDVRARKMHNAAQASVMEYLMG